jgi:hypothetical protein
MRRAESLRSAHHHHKSQYESDRDCSIFMLCEHTTQRICFKSRFPWVFPLKREAFPGIIIVSAWHTHRGELRCFLGQVYLIIISAADLMEILSAGGWKWKSQCCAEGENSEQATHIHRVRRVQFKELFGPCIYFLWARTVCDITHSESVHLYCPSAEGWARKWNF